jgi:hypothetical protein
MLGGWWRRCRRLQESPVAVVRGARASARPRGVLKRPSAALE